MPEKEHRIVNGWYEGALREPSPNFDERPAGQVVDLLVIHAISLPPDEFGGGYIQRFFQNKLDPSIHPYFEQISSMEVSAHFLIERSGKLVQFVATDKRAWHCGESHFCGRDRCNDFAIGIELEGCDSKPFCDVQYARLGELTTAIRSAHPAIAIENIVGHMDIAPNRKTDPGPYFDWTRYRERLV